MTRREFLVGAAAATGLLSVGGSCERKRGPGLLEGIYSSKLGYQHGEDVVLHLATVQTGPVDVWVRDWSLPGWPTALREDVLPSDLQAVADPGGHGAAFEPALSFPASDLAPGRYRVQIPSALLQPETSVWYVDGVSIFPSDPAIAYFTVTNADRGSHSRICSVLDGLTGAAYGAFGDRSIYRPYDENVSQGGYVRRVSLQRPAMNRAAGPDHDRFLREEGYELEFVDWVTLATSPLGLLDPYDLVVLMGGHEYVPSLALRQIEDFLAKGGNLLFASNECAIQRARIEGDRMAVYKWDAGFFYDPAWETPELADLTTGVAYFRPNTVWETELFGQSMWEAGSLEQQGGPAVDLPIYPSASTNWIFQDTGWTDHIPAAFTNFCTGNRIEFAGGVPFIPGSTEARNRTPPGTEVFAAVESLAWDWTRAVPGKPFGWWPITPSHATATYRETPAGGRVVSFPNQVMFQYSTLKNLRPDLAQMFRNLAAELSS